MKITDLVDKKGKVDISKMFDDEGNLDEEALDVLSSKKPIIPIISGEQKKKLGIKVNRDRYSEFPKRLPTFNMLPLPPDEHEHIGLYESKQNLYLITAHAFNILMEKIELLEEELKKLKGQK